MKRPITPRFRIYPALDLKGGIAVRAGGGDRSRYPPLRGRLTGSADALDVCRAFRRELGLEAIYVADLDAISGAPPDARALRALIEDGFHLMVDAGCRSAEDADRLAGIGPIDVVAAVETLPGPQSLRHVVEAIGPDRTVFGLDLRDGRLLEGRSAWPAAPADAARAAGDAGAHRILAIDLARVGGLAGPSPDTIEAIIAARPDAEVIAGGGVRSRADLELLLGLGAAGAVVATALHDGCISRADLERL